MIKSHIDVRRGEVNIEEPEEGFILFDRDAEATRRRGVFLERVSRERLA